tara:strand:- start:2806 stop:3210 length:405 start_codon:yes stop_codon:yes gene_type:complete
MITERWGPRFLIAWYTLFLLLGIIFIGVPDGLITPFMGIFMTVMSLLMIRLVLKFQKRNSSFMKRGLYDSAVFFFWAFSIFGTTSFLVISLVSIFETESFSEAFFFISVAPFPLGISIGAAKQWEMRDVFKTEA